MAKQIVKITVNASKLAPGKAKADVLALGVFEDSKKSSIPDALDKTLNGDIAGVKKSGDFKAAANTTALIYTAGKISAKRLLLIGLGKAKDATLTTFRQAAAKAAFEAVNLKANSLALSLHAEPVPKVAKKLDLTELGKAMAEGIHFGGYRYDEFVTAKKDEKKKTLTATILESAEAKYKKLNLGIKTGQIIGDAQNFARTLANRPANIVFPAQIAAEAKRIAASSPLLTCTVYDEKQLKQKKMGGIIAVGSGSEHKPRMVILKYKPKNAKNISAAPVALVGKAITFDSGGISIKPAQNMHEMKMDMTGGASVLAAMKALAQLKLPIEVTAIICAAENTPSATSYRPGDIIKTYSGKTVEVQNTDAEGRMVLCDGIHHANVLKCKTIIDIATLTGACAVALGKHKAGVMGNDEKLIEKLKQASAHSAEPVWHMPSGAEYAEEMKGSISDLKNIGSSRYGGACTAAAFLSQFAGKTKWAHLDIAGPMDASEPLKKFTEPGSIGFGARLFISYLMSLTKTKK